MLERLVERLLKRFLDVDVPAVPRLQWGDVGPVGPYQPRGVFFVVVHESDDVGGGECTVHPG